jgi:hypothetical protein
LDTKGLRERFDALTGIEELLSVAAPQYRCPEVYFKELILEEENRTIAEKRLRVLEDMLAGDNKEKVRLALERLRRERNLLLKETDWTQLPDVPLEQKEKKAYRKYREYLRNLPSDIELGRLKQELLKYKEWKKWIEGVRYTPGYENYIP